MKEYFDCLILSHGTAFGVGAAIFLLTILLVAKRVIGFTFSVVLLLIALGASWAINNDTFVRSYLDKWIPTTQTSPQYKSTPATISEPTTAIPAKTDTTKADSSDHLKGQIDAQKSRVQDFMNETHPNINPEK